MMQVVVERGVSGLPTVRMEGDGVQYLHSRYDPIQEARQVVDAWEIDDSITTLCVIGLGLGYHVRECLERHPNLCLTVIECYGEVLQAARDLWPMVWEDVRLTVVHPRNEEDFRNALLGQDMEQVRLHAPSIASLPYPEVRAILLEMQTIQSSTRAMSPQLYENWRHNQPSFTAANVLTEQRGMWQNRQGFLIAAGPSLASDLPELRSLTGETSVTLCVSRVLRTLLASDIVPTATVVTESSPAVLQHLAGLEEMAGPWPPLYALATVHPAFIQRYRGPVSWALQAGLSYVEDFARQFHIDLMQTGGSVATLTLQLLYYLGCNPIVFVGQDLAYVDSRAHHDQLSGSPQIEARRHHVSVPSVTGEPITTTISWNSFRRWIETFIREHPDRQYINASHGAQIQGTIYKRLADL